MNWLVSLTKIEKSQKQEKNFEHEKYVSPEKKGLKNTEERTIKLDRLLQQKQKQNYKIDSPIRSLIESLVKIELEPEQCS